MKKSALSIVLIFALNACAKTPAPTSAKGPAPDFELENIAGGKIKAADLKGKVAVLDFWATWCEPCWSEVPKYNKLMEEY